ncbi:MAG: non-canonical purine NTP pyrophosphatase [Candidatus Magasanikbacteria bacterium]
MSTINFATGNKYKLEVAKKALEKTGITVVQKILDIPEIQSTSLEEIASFSVEYACKKLKEPVAVTDAGFFIEALNGFPGPFLKFMNHYLIAEDVLKMMKGKENRRCVFKDVLAYCEPGKKPIVFTASANGNISLKKGKDGNTASDQIFVPDGYSVPQCEISREEMIKFWKGNQKNWKKLAKKLI